MTRNEEKMTKRIERRQAKVIVDLALEAARKVLKSEGLTVEQAGAASYDDSQVTFKIKAVLKNRAKALNSTASQMVGFSKDVIGESFTIKQTTHTIVAITPSRPKYPVTTETQRGARYKFPVSRVKMLLGH
ncbi:hypothetical protein LCGC14_1687920 [marine sediment metagenome]|uniref:Uncharacterized protein n=1 Tax=marine sediment metagenome TaxID=412755 RepID=A0A0F9KLS2_9ZZZZ